MFKTLFIAALPALAVLAQVVPLEPAPGDVFNEDSNCTITWEVDPTGKWTTLNIELMAGSNSDMEHLTTVATVDGTKQSSFTYTCPSVNPNEPIYFYQFSTPADPTNLTWTGRFTIASTSGTSSPATETTDGIAWGNGALTDPSSAVAAPSYLSSSSSSSSGPDSTVLNSTSVAASGSGPSGSPLLPTTASTSAGSALTTVRSSSVPSGTISGGTVSTSSGAPSTTTTTSSGAAALALDLRTRGVQALVGLAGTGLLFATLF